MARGLSMAGGVTIDGGRRSRAQYVDTLFRRFAPHQEAWAREAAEDEDFFYGKQWTADQIQKLERRGMAPLVINRVMPVILQEVAIFTARPPTFRALPRDDTDVRIAHLWSDILAYIWYISNGDSEILQSSQDYFTLGPGYLHAFVDPFEDDGRGEVMFESLPPWDVFPDPNARKIDLSDARAILVSRIVDRDSLFMLYPNRRRAIQNASGDSRFEYNRPQSRLDGDSPISIDPESFMLDEETVPLRLNILYEKIRVPWTRATDMSNGMVMTFKSAPNPVLPEDPNLEYEQFYRTRIRRTVTVGDNVTLEMNILPIDRYPVIPLYLHHNRNPFPKGDVAVVKGLQQEINKRRSIMIHNAALQGNMRMIAEKGAIANKEEFDEFGTTPGFTLLYKKGFEKPEQITSSPLPAAWIQLEAEAKGDLEYAASVFAAQMGSSADAPETYRALLALEEAGQRKIRHKMAHANQALQNLGIVCLQLAQALYTRPKIMRISGENNPEMREVYVNQMQFDILSGELKRINDITTGRFDVVVEVGSSMPTNRMALLNLYMELFQMGAIDHEELLKKTDVVDREGVLQRVSMVNTLRNQLMASEERSKDLEGLNQTLRRQLQQSMIKLEASGGSEQARDQLRQTVMEQKLARARVNDAVKMFQERLGLVQKKVELDGREVVQRARIEEMRRKASKEVSNA